MKITILTLFPDMFQGPFNESIIKRAQEKRLLELSIINIRDFGIGTHKMVDDTPYGGGIGMVLRVDVIHKALNAVRTNTSGKEKVIVMSARGTPFSQTKAKEYSSLDSLIIVCGHYEGIDERITAYIDEEISIGDFVTTGGEIPAMAVTDAVSRLIPGILKTGATENESFSLTTRSNLLLEYPQFTRPETYEGQSVPEVLLSGNHAKIDQWRHDQAVRITQTRRPDLMKKRLDN